MLSSGSIIFRFCQECSFWCITSSHDTIEISRLENGIEMRVQIGESSAESCCFVCFLWKSVHSEDLFLTCNTNENISSKDCENPPVTNEIIEIHWQIVRESSFKQFTPLFNAFDYFVLQLNVIFLGIALYKMFHHTAILKPDSGCLDNIK